MRAGLLTPRIDVMHREEEEVKRVSYDFNSKERFRTPPDRVELIHLTDLQIGSKTFLRKRFVEYRDWILSVPYRFVLLGGDLIDAATVLSVASPYDNTEEPIDQVDEAVDLLEPLASSGRLLASVGGNHERRTLKTFGDVGRTIARELKVPYSRGIQLIDIMYGLHNPYKISLWHGCGGAVTKGAKAQTLSRFMGKGDSQLYLMGHLHDVVVLYEWRQVRQGRRIKLQKIAGIMSSSFQGYWNSYAEVSAMSTTETMMGRVILDRTGGWEVTLR